MTVAIFLGSLIATMMLGIPIAYALLASGVALMWHLDLFDAQILAQNFIHGADSFPLPAVADAAALTALLLPMMVKAGHSPSRSGGLIAASGVIGPIIPPSIGFVIFGVAANVSISKLFLAGIFPGILIGLGLAVTWWWLGRHEQLEVPPRQSRAQVLKAARESLWALMLPVIILVGLRMGVFTPTEAAVVAAVYALVVSTLVYRELSLKALLPIFVTAARTAAIVSASLITVADLPGQMVELLEPLITHPTLLLLAIMVLVMVVGTAMDM